MKRHHPSSGNHVPPPRLPVLLILLLLLLVSCGKSVNTKALFGGKLHLEVTVAENANRNNAVAVDLVMIYDEKLLEKISGLTARAWFERREQIRRDYILEKALEIWQWEWVPGQRVTVEPIPLRVRFVGGFIFADYVSDGDHRVPIDPRKDIRLELLEEEFTARDRGAPAK